MRKEVKANIPVLKYIINPILVAFFPQWICINKDLILFFRLIWEACIHLEYGAFPSLQIYSCSKASLPSKLYRLMSFHWNTHSPSTCPDRSSWLGARLWKVLMLWTSYGKAILNPESFEQAVMINTKKTHQSYQNCSTLFSHLWAEHSLSLERRWGRCGREV